MDCLYAQVQRKVRCVWMLLHLLFVMTFHRRVDHCKYETALIVLDESFCFVLY